MLQEFKEFAMRGNAVDMAVGIVMGVAFGAIISSLVDDVVMPPIGLLLGGVDFSSLFVDLSGQNYASYEAAKEAGAPVIGLGTFINTIINFLIVAFALFLLVRGVNRMTKSAEEAPEAPAEPPQDVVLVTEIRDLLKKSA